MNKNKLKSCLSIACLLTFVSAFPQKVGIFDDHGDIGTGVKPGFATYIPETQQYIVGGAGSNIWADHDEFHFVWKKMKGDFILYARAEFVGWHGVEEHRKVGWMVRKSLDGNSAQVNAVEHGDGLTSLQFRRMAGEKTEEIRSKLTHANIIQLERKGNTYIMRVAKYGEPFVMEQVSDIDLGNDVYVGIFAGSHNSDVVETGVYRDVRITVPYDAVADNRTPMKLGSNLEVMEIATGKREIIYSVPYSIQAPNWTPDGKSFIYNGSDGLVYNFDIGTRKPTLLNTGNVKSNNNDHVLSFDGRM